MRAAEAFNQSFGNKGNQSNENALRLMGYLNNAREKGIQKIFGNLDLAKQRASYTKWKVTENLDKYLVDFEASVLRRGGKVLWAYDAANAIQEVEQILKKSKGGKILHSESFLSLEIGLGEHLRKNGYDYVDTSTTSYFLDLLKQNPYHPVLPSANVDRTKLIKELNLSIRSSLEAGNEEILSDVRDELRRKFYDSEIGLVEADFLIADSGMVVLSENEGDARLSVTFSKTNIILASIDKILPTFADLELFLPLLSTFKNGQSLPAYCSVLGPPLREEIEVSPEFIVLLIDNGRSNVVASQEQRQALSCINCGACFDVCPIFANSEGMSHYQGSFAGPIGQVLNPLQKGLDQYKHLSYASTTCGRCTKVCPVNIDLHNHLLRNRNESVKLKLEKAGEKLSWFTWKKFMLSRKNMNRPSTLKWFTLKQFFKADWGEDREFPKLAEKSFNQLWRERNNL